MRRLSQFLKHREAASQKIQPRQAAEPQKPTLNNTSIYLVEANKGLLDMEAQLNLQHPRLSKYPELLNTERMVAEVIHKIASDVKSKEPAPQAVVINVLALKSVAQDRHTHEGNEFDLKQQPAVMLAAAINKHRRAPIPVFVVSHSKVTAAEKTELAEWGITPICSSEVKGYNIATHIATCLSKTGVALLSAA